jgi:hypothetical protein
MKENIVSHVFTVPNQHIETPVIGFLRLFGEKAAGEFSVHAVKGDALAAFSAT